MINFNRETLLKNSMEDRELAQDILQTYIDSGAEILKNLEKSIAEKDFQNAGLCAHSLYGASSNVGAELLAQASSEAEKASKNCDLENLNELLPRMKALYQDFVAASK